MPCCICGKDITGLQATRSGAGLECCEECSSRLGGPGAFLTYADARGHSAELLSSYAPVTYAEGERPSERRHKPLPAIILIIIGSLLAFYGLTQVFPFLAFMSHTAYFPFMELIMTLIGIGITVWGALMKKI